MLKIRNLSAGYGLSVVLNDMSIDVPADGFIAIVGPNGAGKTTLFKAISGVVKTVSGTVEFDGQDLLKLAPSERSHRAIAHVPEGRKVFASLSVEENLEIGLRSNRNRPAHRGLEHVYELFPILAERRSQLAGTLSGGQQQMLAIGRGLAGAPRLLMLDEPSMGLAPAVADTIFERIVDIRKQLGTAILMVEQRVAEALDSCDYAYVLELGRIVLSGSAAELSKSKRLTEAYLGI